MEDIKIDAKLIIKVMCVSFLIGAVIWCGYNIYLYFTKNENEGIEQFEEDMSSSKIEIIGTKENELVDDNFFIQPNPDKKFQINNEHYLKTPKGWGKITFGSGESVAEYSFPTTSHELIVRSLDTAVLDMSDWTEDGTYQDFIEDFMNQIKYKNILDDAEYTTRPLNVGGKEFKIVMIKTEYIIGSYFCLAKDGYAYCLQAIIPKILYTDQWEQNIDKVFSTFRIP